MPSRKAEALSSADNLREQLRLAKAWKKDGKERIRRELAAMYSEKACCMSKLAAQVTSAFAPGGSSGR